MILMLLLFVNVLVRDPMVLVENIPMPVGSLLLVAFVVEQLVQELMLTNLL
jgi:hypothetical protein